MIAKQLDRRQLLKGLGAGALAAGAAVTLAPTTALAHDAGVTGTWNINIHPSGQATFPGVTTFAPGGVMSNTDANSGSAGLGVWQGRAGGKFVFTFTTFDLSHGSPGVAVVISGHGAVEGNSLHASFKVSVAGTPAGVGTVDGTRMTM
jgi:hypothetical protein